LPCLPRRTYLQFWNTSFAAYLTAVGGSATDPNAGNRSALLADANMLTYPDGSCASVFAVLLATACTGIL